MVNVHEPDYEQYNEASMAPVRRGLQDFCELAGESGRAGLPTRVVKQASFR